MLRTVLTALIIAIGITSLVGILTAIDGIQSSVNNNFASMGVNTFDIKLPEEFGRRRGGRKRRDFAPITHREAVAYRRHIKETHNATVSVSSVITMIAEGKFRSKKTNPNLLVMGGDDEYLNIKGYTLASGRNFSQNDLENSLNVAIVGSEVATKLFENKIDPLSQVISIGGNQYTVVGVLAKKGSFTGGSDDRMILLPLETGRAMAANRQLSFGITTSVANAESPDFIIEEARSLMRRVRKDPVGRDDSFEIERADAFAKDFEDITGYLRWGGFGIGFITLLGASIALMNIMLVSVTERTREIGIRKSLGATPYLIRLQFLMEAVVICILGGLGGLVLGITIGNIISRVVSESPNFIVPWAWMIMGIAICVFVGIVSGIYPAIKASKLDPIEALRHE